MINSFQELEKYFIKFFIKKCFYASETYDLKQIFKLFYSDSVKFNKGWYGNLNLNTGNQILELYFIFCLGKYITASNSKC